MIMKKNSLQKPINEIISIEIDRDNFSDNSLYRANQMSDEVKEVGKLNNNIIVFSSDPVIDFNNDKAIHINLYDQKNDIVFGELVLILMGFFKYKSYKVAEINLAPQYQGKGLGFKLYKFLIQKLNYTMVSDSTQSSGGESIWLKLWKTPGIHVYGMYQGQHSFLRGHPKTEFFQVEPDEDGILTGDKYGVYYDGITADEIEEKFESDYLDYIIQIKDMIKYEKMSEEEGHEKMAAYEEQMMDEINAFELNKTVILVATNEKMLKENKQINEIVSIEVIKDYFSGFPRDQLSGEFKKIGKIDNVTILLSTEIMDFGSIEVIRVYLYDEMKNTIIGKMHLSQYGPDSHTVIKAAISPKYQGQNLGYKLYKLLIQKVNITLVSDKEQSPGGQSIWTKLWKTPGIFVYGAYEKQHAFLRGDYTEYFQVEPDEDGILVGKHDVYYNEKETDDIEFEYLNDYNEYADQIEDMIQDGGISREDGDEKLISYEKEMSNELNSLKLNTKIILVATNEKLLKENKNMRIKELMEPHSLLGNVVNENYKLFESEEADGDCFDVAGRHMIGLSKGFEEMKLVHALVQGQGPLVGRRFGHAFNLIGDVVLDKSNGNNIAMRKEAYFALGKINKDEPGAYAEYTAEETAIKILKHEHWGPWDLNSALEEGIPRSSNEIGNKRKRISNKTLQRIKKQFNLKENLYFEWQKFK